MICNDQINECVFPLMKGLKRKANIFFVSPLLAFSHVHTKCNAMILQNQVLYIFHCFNLKLEPRRAGYGVSDFLLAPDPNMATSTDCLRRFEAEKFGKSKC